MAHLRQKSYLRMLFKYWGHSKPYYSLRRAWTISSGHLFTAKYGNCGANFRFDAICWDLRIWNTVKILRCNWSRLNDMDISLTRFNTQYECMNSIVHKCWCKFSAFSWMISLIEFHGWADCSNSQALHGMNWSFSSK